MKTGRQITIGLQGKPTTEGKVPKASMDKASSRNKIKYEMKRRKKEQLEQDIKSFEFGKANNKADDIQKQIHIDLELQRLRTSIEELRTNSALGGASRVDQDGSQWSRWSPSRGQSSSPVNQNSVYFPTPSAHGSQYSNNNTPALDPKTGKAQSMFVLSSAPINSFQSIVNGELNTPNENSTFGGAPSTAPVLHLREQTARYNEMQALFTLPSETYEETMKSQTARKASPRSEMDDMREEIRKLKLQVQTDKHGERMGRNKRAPVRPANSPSSTRKWRGRNAFENSPESGNNINGPPSPIGMEPSALTINSGGYGMDGNGSLSSVRSPTSKARQKLIQDAVAAAKAQTWSKEMTETEFNKLVESIKDNIEKLVHETVHEELLSTSKERHYTKRAVDQFVMREQDTLEGKMEKKLGDKIFQLKNELASLRVSKLNNAKKGTNNVARRRVRPEGEDGDMSDTSAEEHEKATNDTAALSRRGGATGGAGAVVVSAGSGSGSAGGSASARPVWFRNEMSASTKVANQTDQQQEQKAAVSMDQMPPDFLESIEGLLKRYALVSAGDNNSVGRTGAGVTGSHNNAAGANSNNSVGSGQATDAATAGGATTSVNGETVASALTAATSIKQVAASAGAGGGEDDGRSAYEKELQRQNELLLQQNAILMQQQQQQQQQPPPLQQQQQLQQQTPPLNRAASYKPLVVLPKQQLQQQQQQQQQPQQEQQQIPLDLNGSNMSSPFGASQRTGNNNDNLPRLLIPSQPTYTAAPADGSSGDAKPSILKSQLQPPAQVQSQPRQNSSPREANNASAAETRSSLKSPVSSRGRSSKPSSSQRARNPNEKEIKSLEIEFRSAMAELLNLADLKASIKKELKDWTKEFELQNGRLPTNEDKATINERFLAYKMVSNQVDMAKKAVKANEERRATLKSS